MSGVELLGYSERGVLNALLYEIKYRPNSNCLLNKLIGESVFPFADEKPSPADTATIFLEQSLSGFGTADAIVLASSGNEKYVVFIEAKVQTYGDIDAAFKEFNFGIKADSSPDGFTSVLFTQLFFKQKLVKHDIGENNKCASFGKAFFTTKKQKRGITKRKIGKNPVVLDVAEQIRKHNDNAFYLMILPDDSKSLEKFFARLPDHLPEVPEWSPKRYGYLAWQTVKTFCEDHDLKNTLAVFDYNGEQIFKET